ncbi:hypothetical protein HJG60_011626 [Phyllostomus discolor]|uniref:Uncharacterized protein n=1 Tax=Phyllostomus discolor TaxID=89673 RepID=A0A833ZW66_9CHIR|nr:hypothetical protein HJG60_011626 [Phyllostomus discolor]
MGRSLWETRVRLRRGARLLAAGGSGLAGHITDTGSSPPVGTVVSSGRSWSKAVASQTFAVSTSSDSPLLSLTRRVMCLFPALSSSALPRGAPHPAPFPRFPAQFDRRETWAVFLPWPETQFLSPAPRLAVFLHCVPSKSVPPPHMEFFNGRSNSSSR